MSVCSHGTFCFHTLWHFCSAASAPAQFSASASVRSSSAFAAYSSDSARTSSPLHTPSPIVIASRISEIHTPVFIHHTTFCGGSA